MLSLNPTALAEMSIPVGTGWPLGACMEARGRQDLWIRQKPEVLAVLREQAIIQSAESSNRIEGVTIAPDRLRPVVLGNATPRDRSEEELAGYRQALDWTFSRQRPVPVTPAESEAFRCAACATRGLRRRGMEANGVLLRPGGLVRLRCRALRCRRTTAPPHHRTSAPFPRRPKTPAHDHDPGSPALPADGDHCAGPGRTSPAG